MYYKDQMSVNLDKRDNVTDEDVSKASKWLDENQVAVQECLQDTVNALIATGSYRQFSAASDMARVCCDLVRGTSLVCFNDDNTGLIILKQVSGMIVKLSIATDLEKLHVGVPTGTIFVELEDTDKITAIFQEMIDAALQN